MQTDIGYVFSYIKARCVGKRSRGNYVHISIVILVGSEILCPPFLQFNSVQSLSRV